MIVETLDRDSVLSCLAAVRAELGALAASLGGRRAGGDDIPEAFSDLAPEDFEAAEESIQAAEERETTQSSGQQGFDGPAEPPAAGRRGTSEALSSAMDLKVFLSRDQDICTLQSAMDEYFCLHSKDRIGRAPPDAEPQPAATRRRGEVAEDEHSGQPSSPVIVTDRHVVEESGARRILNKFSTTDIRWISCLFASAKRKFTGRRELNTSPAVHDIAADAQLLVVGDWASGLPRAVQVAQRMREVLHNNTGHEQHAIHLGDTYYSGWPSEYERRFLPHWPVDSADENRVSSWSLNANHDMYSGGYGYFDTLLKDPRFARHAGCSYFALNSAHWRILGLDTGWKEGDLTDPQLEWVRRQCDEARANKQKVVLLSHHQLVSSYESNGDDLQERLGSLLKDGRIHAWLWGHEHRCMVYAPTHGLRYAACIGHGGVPVYMHHKQGEEYPEPGIFEDRRFIKRGLEHWAYMGFCVLDIEGESLSIRYLDENGTLLRTDKIEV